ncbi:MAG: asparagine synthase (glutamine-hydrolyzing) [Candidatus Omnitrophota bacterium]
MCGICGYVNFDASRRASEDIVRSMTKTLIHRGPDDAGLFARGPAALGHRRLSIIDLDSGHQPIANESGSLTIVQNGEIYNYKDLEHELKSKGHHFRTRSDTEVILHAYEEYGDDCLEKLDGMFSFAIWDQASRRLFCARDRFGKKPFYYGVFDNQFIFGSEPKAILEHPSARRCVDLQAAARYFAYDYVPSPDTIYKNIKRLEAGHFCIVERSTVRIRQYWDVRFDIRDSWTSDVAGCTERLRRLFREATRKRLVSDVPLGVFLSGGIDSSSVVAMMSGYLESRRIRTFSIGFNETRYDESPSARSVADLYSTDHRQKILDPGQMLEVLPDILDVLDEPFADSSIIPTYLVSRFTREFVKVALGGDGGDEFFMGYPSFAAHALAGPIDRFPWFARRALARSTEFFSGGSDSMSAWFRLRRFLRGLQYSGALRHQCWIGNFSPAELEELFAPVAGSISLRPEDVYERSIFHAEKARGLDTLDRISYLYIKTYMADDILTKVDRASMANGLEVRSPFLDAEFSGFAATIPHDLKLKGRSGKFILRKAFEGSLPDQVIRKEKHGFAVPVGEWFRNELKETLLGTFKKEKIDAEGLLNYGYIDAIIREHLSGKRDHGRQIWSLFIFEMWYNRWIKKT